MTSGPGLVRLDDGDQRTDASLNELAADAHRAAASADPVAAAGELAERLGDRIPPPGTGRTREVWESLATLGAVDLTVARTVEPHLDARAILAEAGHPAALPAGLLGVYAAEGPGVRLTARPEGPGPDGADPPDRNGWRLTGTKPWCSLADRVGGFLVTAWVEDDQRRLFLVDRAAVGVGPGSFTVDESGWHARGLSRVRSTGTTFEDVPATPVGDTGWYLRRPGFAWGGMGVAAIWFGGAVAVARRLAQQSRGRAPDQVALMHLGRVEAAVHRASCVLALAADDVDAGRADGAAGARLSLTVRQVVRDAAEDILTEAAHAMGPGPLVLEEVHARRVADLQVYLRHEHAARDAAALGRAVLTELEERAERAEREEQTERDAADGADS